MESEEERTGETELGREEREDERTEEAEEREIEGEEERTDGKEVEGADVRAEFNRSLAPETTSAELTFVSL